MMRTQGYFCTILCQNMALEIHEPRHFSLFSLKLAGRYNTNSHKTKIVTQLKIEDTLVKDKEIAHSN